MLLRGLALASLLLIVLAPATLAAEDGFTVLSGPTTVANMGVTLPNGLTGRPYTCTAVPWSFTIPETQWISPNANCAANAATGRYTYVIFFSVTPGATGVLLSGWVQADDSVTIALNGTPVPLTPSSNGSSFQTNSGFYTDWHNANTLTFTVTNSGGPTGLDFRWHVSWIAPPGGPPGTVLVAPTSKDQCENGGWRDFPQFKNQGQCVRFTAHQK